MRVSAARSDVASTNGRCYGPVVVAAVVGAAVVVGVVVEGAVVKVGVAVVGAVVPAVDVGRVVGRGGLEVVVRDVDGLVFVDLVGDVVEVPVDELPEAVAVPGVDVEGGPLEGGVVVTAGVDDDVPNRRTATAIPAAAKTTPPITSRGHTLRAASGAAATIALVGASDVSVTIAVADSGRCRRVMSAEPSAGLANGSLASAPVASAARSAGACRRSDRTGRASRSRCIVASSSAFSDSNGSRPLSMR